MIRVGLVGYGYWGPNLARVLERSDRFELVAITDTDDQRCEVARRSHRAKVFWGPSATGGLISGFDRGGSLDALVVATPVSTHYDLVLTALEQGLHVLCAKPLTVDVTEAQHLAEVAIGRNLVLLTDHTFLFTGAVRKMRQLVDAGELGQLLYVDAARVNLGLVQRDVNVLWDLAPHDVSILLSLTGSLPQEVLAVTADPIGAGRASLAHLTMWFGDVVAHVHVNWLSPVKVRRMLVAGDKKMIVYDDVEPVEKIRVYDSGVDVSLEERQVGYRTGDISSPVVDIREALATEADHFADCIETRGQSMVAGPSEAVDVIRVISAAQHSAFVGGRVRV